MLKRISLLRPIVLFLALALTACSMGAPAPTATPTMVPATETPIPTATATVIPTDTPTPTATPDVAATQQAEKLQALLVELKDNGYIDTTDGSVTQLDDFKKDWSDIAHYNWWNIRKEVIADFVLSGHFRWSTAGTTNQVSGCGIIFGLQENDDFYGVFLDKARIQFTLRRGTYLYSVGVTKGSGRLSFGNPAETDMVLVVKGQKSFIKVDGKYIEYSLSADQTSAGGMAYSILTSSAKDYGTHCEMTNMVLWRPK